MLKFTQKSIEYKTLSNIRINNLAKVGDRVVVALSGGPDSVCLLDVLSKLKDALGIEVLACHYNHNLRGEASQKDEDFVKKICKDKGIECFFGHEKSAGVLKNEGKAREARYSFFQKILKEGKGDLIATAHTANDNAETFLLRLSRGTGLSGLRSIPLRREKIIRPLLIILRSEIEDYLNKNALSYVLDESNKDTRFKRNFIRHNVLPQLSKINPNIIDTLSSSALLVSDELEFLNSLTHQSVEKIIETADKDKIVIDRRKWLNLSPVLRKTSLRSIIEDLSKVTDITQNQITECCILIEKGEGNKLKILPNSLRLSLKSDKIVISVQKQ